MAPTPPRAGIPAQLHLGGHCLLINNSSTDWNTCWQPCTACRFEAEGVKSRQLKKWVKYVLETGSTYVLSRFETRIFFRILHCLVHHQCYADEALKPTLCLTTFLVLAFISKCIRDLEF